MKRKILAVSALILALTGCTEVDTGKVIDKIRQASQFRDGKDICRFWLEDASGFRGWLEVDCDTVFQEYEIGEHYPR